MPARVAAYQVELADPKTYPARRHQIGLELAAIDNAIQAGPDELALWHAQLKLKTRTAIA
jgi:hypothetical protein